MKFIVTKEVGKLSRWLRILGFDTDYFRSDNIGTLILIALREDRIIITRRKEKINNLEKKTVVVNSNKLEEQLAEVVNKLGLAIDEEKMFSRCTVCNSPLAEAEKESIKEFIPEHVYKTQNLFMHCPACKKIYWQGSHWGNVKKVVAQIKDLRTSA